MQQPWARMVWRVRLSRLFVEVLMLPASFINIYGTTELSCFEPSSVGRLFVRWGSEQDQTLIKAQAFLRLHEIEIGPI